MITLIHGTDSYLSYKYLNGKKEELQKQGYDIKTVNVDNDFEVTDPTVLYGILSEQDLFGSSLAIILKRTTSANLFYKLGKPLKTTSKLFDSIKNSPNEIILWEDKAITAANPIYKLAKEVKIFSAPQKDYEVSGYIQSNFKDLSPNIKKILVLNLKSTDTNEIATEIQKLLTTPQDYLDQNNLVLSSNTPAWIISDAITNYVVNPNEINTQKLFNTINSVDEDNRYKLAIVQGHIGEMIYVKKIKKTNDKSLQEKIFNGRRAFVFQKIDRAISRVSIESIFELFQKSLYVEYLLNNGLITESVALETIFLGDVKSMSWELLFE